MLDLDAQRKLIDRLIVEHELATGKIADRFDRANARSDFRHVLQDGIDRLER